MTNVDLSVNIRYERGIITQKLCSIMVMMALVTTLMAIELIHGRRGRRAGTVGAVRTG